MQRGWTSPCGNCWRRRMHTQRSIALALALVSASASAPNGLAPCSADRGVRVSICCTSGRQEGRRLLLDIGGIGGVPSIRRLPFCLSLLPLASHWLPTRLPTASYSLPSTPPRLIARAISCFPNALRQPPCRPPLRSAEGGFPRSSTPAMDPSYRLPKAQLHWPCGFFPSIPTAMQTAHRPWQSILDPHRTSTSAPMSGPIAASDFLSV